MTAANADPRHVLAWLTGRSLARGVPPPVADHGGYRVDTRSDVEVSRWVFPAVNDGLSQLARSIRSPGYLLKWLGSADDVRAILPNGWHIQPPAYFMQAGDDPAGPGAPKGYRIAMSRTGPVISVRILDDGGALAASGYAADTPDAFVYDRIVTAPEHRRKGLGRLLMATLGSAKRHALAPSLLAATEDGRALYTALGWRTISPYWTAEIVAT